MKRLARRIRRLWQRPPRPPRYTPADLTLDPGRLLLGPYEVPAVPFDGADAGAHEPPPAPVLRVKAPSIPTERTDEDLHARWKAAVAPLTEYLVGLARLGDDYRRGRIPVTAPLAWLLAWAEADALQGNLWRSAAEYDEDSHQEAFERYRATGSIALAYLKLRGDPAVGPAERQRIEAWLQRLGALGRNDAEMQRAIGATPNNHAYWGAYGVCLAAVATNDHDNFLWALRLLEYALNDVRPDGTLPRELSRGEAALHYHNYSIQPLLYMTVIARFNGLDLISAADHALDRLAGLTAAGIADPGVFRRLTGLEQITRTVETPDQLCWLLLHRQRSADPRVHALAETRAEVNHKDLGGDPALWGEPGRVVLLATEPAAADTHRPGS